MGGIHSRATHILVRIWGVAAVLGSFAVFFPPAIFAQPALPVFKLPGSKSDLPAAKQSFLKGEYPAVVRASSQAAASEKPDEIEEWALLHSAALTAMGQYADAHALLTASAAQLPQSIRVRWALRDAALALGRGEEAEKSLTEIAQLTSQRRWAYRDPPNLVVFGRVALTLGADPKDVLDRIYSVAQKAAPALRDVYLARGELALEKHDFDLAARAFNEGLEKLPGDPDLHFGAARAYEEGQRAAMLASLNAALKINPSHVPSLLLRVDHEISAEDYEAAGKILDAATKVCPTHPDIGTYRAVIALLNNESIAAQLARASALRVWARNPRVDHLIGKKLSQKYRFAEGAAAQRRALRFDSEYLPAKAQLASDLLRLGEEDEGWALAKEVHEKDAYDVEAYNLVTLRDTLAKYTTLENPHFKLRMTTREASIYGPRVLALLTRARERLVSRYGVELVSPTIVEVFGDQKDFAVRTFGLPDVQGFLGVCFGRVVTANSPAALGGKGTNWESVLWHEFCHVVTLQSTQNRMPRWLSEGISVYEERQADSAWGMRMTPRYREMIRNGEVVPISSLSAIFLAPPTPEHLQFAYFQSSLVVEYIVDKFGLDAVKAILASLRAGVSINAAIASHTMPMDELEKEFAGFADRKANEFAGDLAMEKPPEDVTAEGPEGVLSWARNNPKNLWGQLALGRHYAEAKEWEQSIAAYEAAMRLAPEHASADSAYPGLAAAYRALGNVKKEQETLLAWTARNDTATEASLRLMELASAEEDWAQVARGAERFLAVNPLVAAPYRQLAIAAERLGDLPRAIAAGATMLQLDPPNPSDVHFQLARLMHSAGDRAAKTHLLAALEDAPRHREALSLLLKMQREARP